MSWDGSTVAVLLMNHITTAQDLKLSFDSIPGLTKFQCVARDLWARADIGTFTGSFTASSVAGHDAAFLLLTCM